MSDQDFVIVDEEKDSEIPQEKENRTEDSRKEVVKDAEKEREDDDGYEKICFICQRPEMDMMWQHPFITDFLPCSTEDRRAVVLQ